MSEVLEKPGEEVEYPTGDGKPMAESDIHWEIATYVVNALKQRFKDRSDVYVAGNNFLYYEQGNPRACVSPDAYVVFGVPSGLRDCYKSWDEGGKLPAVVFEFTSRSTMTEDRDTKHPRYERELRAPEYFLFDPTGDYLRPRFQAYRLERGRYVPLKITDGCVRSRELGLEFVQQGEGLRIRDPETGEWLRSYEEAVRACDEAERGREEAERGRELEVQARTAAEDRARVTAERAQLLERENERLRAEMETYRKAAGG